MYPLSYPEVMQKNRPTFWVFFLIPDFRDEGYKNITSSFKKPFSSAYVTRTVQLNLGTVNSTVQQ